MLSQELSALVSFVGLFSQAASAVMLAALFLVLGRNARRRRFFGLWALGWVALAVALLALVARYTVLSSPNSLFAGDGAPAVRLFYGIYQLGKLGFFLLLAAGVANLVHGTRPSLRVYLASGLAAVGWATASALGCLHLDQVVTWQAPVALGCLGASARMLWQARGKSLGVRLSGWLLAVLTALWVVYLLSFSGAFADGPPLLATAAIAVARYNSFNDLLLQVLLGYGMVLILMEDLNREMDAAYSELAVAHGRLRQASLHDSLTGLLNRRAFDEGVGLATTRGTHGSVVMIDTDNLKIINDTHGHAAGDALLRQVADTLRRAVRAADKVYRWGGDEFLVVLPRSRSPEVRTRLVAALAEAGNLRLGEPGAEVEVEVAVSLGAADYRDAAELTAAIRRADLEMYEEKKRRREAARRIGRTA